MASLSQDRQAQALEDIRDILRLIHEHLTAPQLPMPVVEEPVIEEESPQTGKK